MKRGAEKPDMALLQFDQRPRQRSIARTSKVTVRNGLLVWPGSGFGDKMRVAIVGPFESYGSGRLRLISILQSRAIQQAGGIH